MTGDGVTGDGGPCLTRLDRAPAPVSMVAVLMVAVFVIAAVAAMAGIGVRATYGAHVAVDEPQYLLTALSLAEDGDLDISDELAQQRWRAFADVELPVQTRGLPGGREVSPHDALLPLLLALPMGLGGWVAAKVTLALLAGALAALVLWTAVRRLAVPPRLAVPAVAVAFSSAPLAVYGQQVYPELPAALAVIAAVAVLLGPVRPLGVGALGLCVTALPWLGAKYAPVAAALAALALYRLLRSRRPGAAVALGAGLAVMAAGYALVHRLVWGGWTVYASGDHFQTSGELGVVGLDPNYAGRALRLVGLLVDRGFGLAAWQPAWLLVLPALAAGVRVRPRGSPGSGAGLFASPPAPQAPRASLTGPLFAGWLTATFAALTMHGFWWPGRQVVVVLPLALLVILVALDRLPGWVRMAGLGLGVSGVLTYAWMLADGLAGRLTWVTGFERVGYPGYQLLRPLLPDYRAGGDLWSGFWPLHLAWIAAFVALAAAGWRGVRTRDRTGSRTRPQEVPIHAPIPEGSRS